MGLAWKRNLGPTPGLLPVLAPLRLPPSPENRLTSEGLLSRVPIVNYFQDLLRDIRAAIAGGTLCPISSRTCGGGEAALAAEDMED